LRIGDTFNQLPTSPNIDENLLRALNTLIEQLDIAFGNRGDSPFALNSTYTSVATSLEGLREDFNKLDQYFLLLDSSNLKEKLTYQETLNFNNDNDLINKKYVDDRVEPQTAPEKLASDASEEDIINKINEIIDVLTNAKILT